MDVAVHSPQRERAQVVIRWQAVLIPLGLALFSILIYANTFNHELMHSWDDNRYIKENYLLRDFSLQGLINIYTQPYFAAYIPVTLTTYWVEFALWEMNPAGYHVVNVLFHAANTVLLYFLLMQMFRRRSVAVLAAILFVVHPLQVETVAWVAERKNLVAMFFTLLATMAHLRSTDTDAPRWALPVSWVMLALAAFAKPIMVGLPLLFIAYDFFWIKMSFVRVVRRNVVPVLIVVVAAASIILAHGDYGGIKDHRGDSILTTAEVMMVVFADYVVALFLPVRIDPINHIGLDNFYRYPASIISEHPLSVLSGFLLLVGTLGYAGWHLWRAWRDPQHTPPFAVFTILWVWLMLAPVSNIIPIAIERTDRYIYFPAVTLFALAALGVVNLWDRLNVPSRRYTLGVVVGAVLIVLSFLTVERNMVWQNEGALWRDHLTKYPQSGTGLLNLGVYYFNNRLYPEATEQFVQLLQNEPLHFKGNRFMGHIAVNEDRFEDAIPYYRQALRSTPNDPITNNFLGLSYYRTGDMENAIRFYARAIEVEPDQSSNAYSNLGNAALRVGNNTLAVNVLTEAVERNPRDARAYSDLCAAMSGTALNDAILYCQRAVELEPRDGLFLGRLGHLLIMDERYDEALPIAQRTVEVSPNLSLSYRVLGDALVGTGDPETAVAAYQRALELDPQNTRAIAGLERLTGSAP